MLSDSQNANLKNNFNSNSVSLFNFIYYRYFNEKYSKFMHDKEKKYAQKFYVKQLNICAIYTKKSIEILFLMNN